MPRKKTMPKPAPEDWMSRVKESSHDIFLAGLASLARARGQKTSSSEAKRTSDFDSLVAEGRKLEPELKTSVQKTWEELQQKSRGPRVFKPEGKLQEVMEERVAAALTRLGVPTRKDFDALSARVDALMAAAAPAGRVAASRRKPGAQAGKEAAARKSVKASTPRPSRARPKTKK